MTKSLNPTTSEGESGFVAPLHEGDFEALFQASPAPLLVITPPLWIIVAANEARLRVTGKSLEAQIGQPLFELFPDDPDDPTADGVRNLGASLDRVVATKAPDTMAIQRYAVRNAHGEFEERWWAPVNTPVLRDGEIAYVVHQVEDVTEIVRLRDEAAENLRLARDQQDVIDRLRRAESELRKSEEFNRRVLASSEDCIKVLDLAGRLEFMSEGGMCVMEVDDFAAIEGGYWPDFWGGPERPKVVNALEEARRGRPARFGGFATTLKGSPRWWDVIVSPMNDADGSPEKLISISRDVTHAKLAEDLLRGNEEKLRELNATLERRVEERTAERDKVWRIMRDVLAVVDSTGVVRAVNPAWRTILGHDEPSVVGRKLLDFVWPEDVEKTGIGLAEAAAGRDLTNFEVRYKHKDGSPRWLSWVTSAEGDLVYASGRDITAEKERDAELENAQEALRQAQKMEAMGQLTGGVAHDFNNLLTPILGSLDMLQRRGLSGKREQRLIDGAMQSAERARTLVQRLLAFARRQPLQAVAVDVATLVIGMRELVESTVGPQIAVSIEAAEGLPFAKADANQLEMALLNLSVNARDAMPTGGTLRIAISAPDTKTHSAGTNEDRQILLSVSDSGEGMDEATLAHAVEPFFSTKGVGKGTGLGLSMVHGLVLQLGGAMTIKSRPGLGTQVDIRLPCASETHPSTGPVATAHTIHPAGGTALLVDDEEAVRMSTADMLADLGYTVLEAGSAKEAIAILDGGKTVDLLVTDHLMPGMTGTELALQVRSARPGVPVLLVSGYAEPTGADPRITRLTKPFRKDELAASLARLTM